MPDCAPTGRERWSDEWEYVGAAPSRVVTPHGPAQVGIAMAVIYVWRRPFDREFVCCEGERQVLVWVGGNWAIWTHDRYDAGQPVRTINVPVPGKLADALGASVTLGEWWEDPDAVDGERPAGPEAGDSGNQPEILSGTPRADCGEFVHLPDGTRVAWTDLDGAPPVTDPEPEGRTVELHPWPPQEDDCCGPLDVAGRRPKLEMAEFPRLELLADGRLNLTGRLTISHGCALEDTPSIEIGIVQQAADSGAGAAAGGGPADYVIWFPEPRLFHTRRMSADRKRCDVEFRGHGVSNPDPRALRLRIRFRVVAVSKCRGRLDMTLTGPTALRAAGSGAVRPGCMGVVFNWLRA